MNRKNILMIVSDQFRGDCLGFAGHPDVKTPYLDALALRGAYFPNMYSSCPTCIPARAALMTGLSQEHHGRVGYRDRVAWRYERTLAGELSSLGYYTKCVGKMHVHPQRSLQGYQHIELHDGFLHTDRLHSIPFSEHQAMADDYLHWLKQEKGIDCDITDTALDCNSWLVRPWPYAEELHPTNWVTSRALDFLRTRDPEKPFFLTASYVRPHPPLDPPQWCLDMYLHKQLREPPIGDWEAPEDASESKLYNASVAPSDRETRQRMMAGYYACITHLDNQIGRLLNGLWEAGLMEDTLVLFVSDHGEELGDHRLFRKSCPYQGSSHVPLILNGPGIRPGTRPGALCELRDVMPTLVSFAGGVPEGVDGVNLLDFVDRPDESPRELLHGEHLRGELSCHWLVSDHDKYIWHSQTGREQYFDLARDPKENHDGISDPAYKARVDALRKEMIRVLTNRPEGFVQNGKLAVGRPLRDWIL